MSKKEDAKTKLDIKISMNSATKIFYNMLLNSKILSDFDDKKIDVLYNAIVLNKSFKTIAEEVKHSENTVTHIFWTTLNDIQNRFTIFSSQIHFIDEIEKRSKMLETENIKLKNMLKNGTEYIEKDTTINETLKEKIKILNISHAAINALNRSNVFTIEQIIMLTKEQLFTVRNISDKTIAGIENNLKNMGLSLATNKTVKVDTSTADYFFMF